MKEVSVSFVLKRLLTDPAFFKAASAKVDSASSVCEYQMTKKDSHMSRNFPEPRSTHGRRKRWAT